MVVWFIYGLFMGETPYGILHDDFYWLIITFSFFFSVPCLLVAWALLKPIVVAPYSKIARLFLWIVAVVVIIVLMILVCLASYDEINMNTFKIAIPSIIAAVLAVLIRYQQFQKLIDLAEVNHDEKELV
jgi:peptidoglycan/LPS O-acetylase OafA/YrhL